MILAFLKAEKLDAVAAKATMRGDGAVGSICL